MTKLFILILLATSTSFASRPTLNFSGVAHSAVPACDKNQALHAHKNEIAGGLSALPQGLIVARQVRFFVATKDSEGQTAKMETFQSFINLKSAPKAKVLCGTAEAPVYNRFTMTAPTLIKNEDRKNQIVFWQFQILVENQNVRPWNTRSLALGTNQNLEKAMHTLGYEVKVYELKKNQIEIVYSKKSGSDEQILSITYDVD